MLRTKLDRLKRKKVEIRANGIIYRGILLEATEDEVTLKGNTGYITVSMDRITSITDPSEKIRTDASKYIDPSFFTADQEVPKEPQTPVPGDPKKDDPEKKEP